MPKSRFANPGPMNVLRPSTPYVPMALAAKLAAFKYCEMIAWWFRSPGKRGSPNEVCRCPPAPVNALSTPLVTETVTCIHAGDRVQVPAAYQRASSGFAGWIGNSYKPLKLKTYFR